jgi:hypothetical protein
MKLCVYRGGELAVEVKIPLHEAYYQGSNISGIVQTIYCVTWRRKHPVVEAVKPGDKLHVFVDSSNSKVLGISTLEANVCVVYNGGKLGVVE